MSRDRKDQAQRARLRARLRAEGESDVIIAGAVAALTAEQRTKAAEKARTNRHWVSSEPIVARRKWSDAERARREAEWERLERQRAAQLGWDGDAYVSPDDSKFRPRPPDPLLTGPARASGTTAKVVRRRSTITRYEYDQAERRSEPRA